MTDNQPTVLVDDEPDVFVSVEEAIRAIIAQDTEWFNDALIDIGNHGMETSLNAEMIVLTAAMTDSFGDGNVTNEYIRNLAANVSKHLAWLGTDDDTQTIGEMVKRMCDLTQSLTGNLHGEAVPESAPLEDFLKTFPSNAMVVASEYYEGSLSNVMTATWGVSLSTGLLFSAQALFPNGMWDAVVWDGIIKQISEE